MVTATALAGRFADRAVAAEPVSAPSPSGLASAKLFKKLAAVETGHFVIAKNGVRRLVNDFEEGVGAVVGQDNFANWFKGFADEIAD